MEFHPIDNLRNNFSNMRAHPFQTAARFGLGLVNPALGMAARQGFNAYNNRQNNNAASTALDMTHRSGDQAMQQGMDRPLNGPLGNVPQSDNSALAGALMGGNNAPHAGNSMNGWNMSQNYGASHPSGGLLDFLGPVQQQTPNGSFFTDPQYAPGSGKLKERQSQGFAGMPFGTGVTNFMVGGSPVINGVNPGMGNYNRFGGSSQAVVRGRTPGN